MKGNDGKYRIVYYDSNGYLQLNCYAKDFNNFTIGKHTEPTAQELIEECERS